MTVSLVDDWRAAWKWLSTWLVLLSTTALELYEQVPQFQTYIPPNVFHHLMVGLVGLILVGRLIKQGQSNAPTQ